MRSIFKTLSIVLVKNLRENANCLCVMQAYVMVTSFSVFYFYYCLKNNLCLKSFLPSPVCHINTVLACLITWPVSDFNVASKSKMA